MKIFIEWIILSFAVMISAYIIPGVSVPGFATALWFALILGIINISLKPILIILTLPINLLTLGLFTFVINAGMILLASALVKGFGVEGFFTALIFSILLSFFNYILHSLFGTKKP